MKISKLAIKSVFVAGVLSVTACASVGDGTVALKATSYFRYAR